MKFYLAILLILTSFLACNNNTEKQEDVKQPVTIIDVVNTQRDIEQQSINKYLEKKGLVSNQTKSGLFYIIHKQGEGKPIDENDDVTFDIVSKFLNDSEFYSSKSEGQPLGILIGQNMVVQGLEDGLKLLNEGGKATLYIPSHLAYGEEGSGSLIPPNTVLIHEIEVIEVKKL